MVGEEKRSNLEDLIHSVHEQQDKLKDGFDVDFEGETYSFIPEFKTRMDKKAARQMTGQGDGCTWCKTPRELWSDLDTIDQGMPIDRNIEQLRGNCHFIFGRHRLNLPFSGVDRMNKENNVFKDALGVKGLGFNHHGNHGSHYGNHHGNYHDNHSNHHCNYHDNHSNHHGNYHAEQLLFSCQCSKVSSCQVRFLGTRDMLVC